MEEKMKKFVVFILFLSLISIPIISQEEDQGAPIEEIFLKSLPAHQTSIMAAEDGIYVKALMVGASWEEPTNADWAALDFASEYISGDVWNMMVVVVNYSDNPVKVNIEFELRWNDGAKKIYRRFGARTIEGATVMMYMTDITNQIKQLGLFTLYGRVSGLGVGNTNEVVTQLYVY
jgi:hypothetical protein